MSEARRLHPFTLLFEAMRVARAFVVPALVGGASAGSGDFGQMLVWGVAFLSIPALLAAVAKYLTFRYRLAGEELILDSGVLSKSRRVIPLARVQNIDIQQSALQRIFGVAELSVETAGGNRTEAVLTVLAQEEAQALREELLAQRRRVAGIPEREAAPEATVLARLSTGELAIAGATANEAGLVAALLAGGLQLLGQLRIELPEPDIDPEMLVPGAPGLGIALLVAAAIAFFLVLAWLFSVVGAVLRYYGFTLERTEDELRKRYGLLSRREAIVPLRRVQAIRVEESLLRRPFGLATLKIETAGAAPGQRQRGGAEAFLPLARGREVPRLIAALFGGLDYGELRFLRVHPRARRRAFVRYSVPIVVAAGALALLRGTSWLWLLGLLPLAYGFAHLHYRHLGYAPAAGYVVARGGFLNRITWIVPDRKVQTLHVRQTPFQRRHGLATLVADTAAGEARVVDLAQNDALLLLRELTERVARVRQRAPSPDSGGGENSIHSQADAWENGESPITSPPNSGERWRA
ncbi:MAG: PH domain-containing protein [Gemmatimonadota bacterium]|nr:PH domain-containing protein [Gemmatimonadota bacterium]